MIDVTRNGTVALCDGCAEPLYAGHGPELLSGGGDCALCGEKSWDRGVWTGKVHYYRPRYVAEMMPHKFKYEKGHS